MKKLYAALILLILTILSGSITYAQMVGDNIFLPGGYVEVGIGPNGCLGTTRGAPAGYYSRGPGFTNYDPALGTTVSVGANQLLAMLYDQGHDGWTVGTPAYFGDYTLPGTPFEGWSIEINGARSNAWYTDYQGGTGFDNYPSGTSAGLAGTNTSYTNAGGELIGVWTGTAGTGAVLQITQTTTVDTLGSWVRFNVKLVNTGATPLTNVYYMRSCDPDNDSYTGGSPTTTNTIDYQNDYAHRVQVTAAGLHYTTQTLSISTKDCRAKCFISPSWPTFVGGSGTLANYYAGTTSGELTALGTSDVGDYATGLVFSLGTIAAGDSNFLSYAYVYDGLLGIDTAISDPQIVTLGTPHDSLDTVAPCAYSGDTLVVNIINGSTNNWLGSTWTWTPSTDLLYTTGTSNMVIGITSMTTYTITGVDTLHGMCESKTFLLTVLPPGTTPPPTVHDTSYCLGATAVPLTAIGSGLLWYTTPTGGVGSPTAPTPLTTTIGVTTYWVSQTIGGCLSARVPINVTIVPLPGVITGPSSVCAGSTITLADTAAGGHWTSSNIAIATVGSSTGIVTGVAAGTATISYTVSTGCSSTKLITVNPLPLAITGVTTVCAGATTTLSDATTGGTWSSSPTTIATVGSGTGIVTGVSAGTATITYTSSAGCIRTTTVTVNPSPLPITGSLNICIGFTSALSDATPGGTWSSTNPLVAPISPTGVVTGLSLGTSVISYFNSGCAATATVTVNPLPSPISGVSSVCVGDTTFVFDGTGGGTWTSSNTAIATVGSLSGLVIGVSAGPVTFTYTLSTGCIATFPMTVNPSPAPISGTPILCIGATSTLTDATVGGFWTSSDPSIAFIDPATGIVTGESAGVAVISYNAGCSAIITVTVNAAPTPILGVPTVCVGGTTSLFDPPGGGTWSSSDITRATVGSTTGVVTGIATGFPTITYTAPGGCSTTLIITVNPMPAAIGGPTSVCVGLTVTETDATIGGTWSSSNPAVATIVPGTGLVTGIAPGVVTITYTLGTGCAATRSFTVNSSPGGITGPPSVCVGSTITLSDITIGGTWTSAPVTTATIGSLSGIVTGINPGLATITYSLGAGCSTTTTVNVAPLPAVIAGLPNVCVGSTITLTDGTLGGTWTSSVPADATIGPGTGVVTGIAPGVTVITYTLGTGCTRTKPVTVNPSPTLYTVVGGGSYCAGGTGVHIGLSGSAIGATYQLYLAGLPVGAVVPGTGSPLDFGVFTAAGTYTVKATTTVTGCSITMTGSAVITINPLPTAFTVTGGGSYCAGGTGFHIFLSSSSAGVNYQLLLGGLPVGTPVAGTGGVLDLGLQTAAGTYTVVATNAVTGCIRNMTGSAVIVINPLPVITGPLALCPTATITLVGTPAGGGWVSGTPAVATITPATGVVTGVTTGTTVITYTAGGCVSNVTVTVTPGPTAITGPPTVCAGTTVTLTDGVPGGVWTSSNPALATVGSLSGIVTGVVPGSPVTITYSLGSGCIVTKLMTVNASPAAITGILQVCVGNTTTLADPTPGGVWSSTAPAVGTISGGGIVTGISGGTTLISYTVAGCPALANVTVNPLPNPIGGTLSVCVGQTTPLNDGIPGGTWSSAAPAIATIGTAGIVTGITTGTSVITYTLATGCFKIAVVTVNPLPLAIGGPGTVCQGLTINLTDGTPGGGWTSGTPAVATISGTGLVTGITPGTSLISYTTGITGCAQTKTVTVTPVPTPVIGSTGVCVGQTTILSDAVTGGTWASGTPAVATIGSTSGIVLGIAPGTSTITYTVGGCSTITVVTVIGSPLPITGPPKVCIGGTILKSDPSPGGTWSSSDPAVGSIDPTSGIVTGIASGTVIISYEVGTGCYTIATVVVNPVSPILGIPIVCQGQTTTLSDTTLGGTWTSGTPAVATVTSLTGIVTGMAPGTTVITYTLPTGCTTAITVTVNAVPLPITGTPQVCVGQTTGLLDAAPGGTWSSSNIAVGTISPTGIVTGLSAGTTTISYTLGTGCAAIKVVTVNSNPPAITGSTDVCLGNTITLHDAVGGGVWTSSNPAIASIGTTSGVVNGLTLGTVTIGYTLGTGCSVTTVVNVDSLPGPITGTMNLCVGTTTNLYDVTTGGTWSSASPVVATVGAGTGIVTGNSPGPAVITYSIGAGCTAHATVTVNLIPVGISGATSVCLGQTTTLTDATPGGSWSSSNPAIATIGSTSGIVTGITPGSVTISYSLGTGCNTTMTMVVNPGPLPITGVPLICLGSTTTLSDATPLGTWSSSDITVAPVSPGGVVSGLALGTATISYTAGCTTTQVVTVNPLPSAISGNPNVCVGATTTLSDLIGGGVWSSSNPTIATIGTSSGVVTGMVPGTVTITYSLGAGCVATINITVNPLPASISGLTQVCATQTITLSDATFGGVWSSGTIGTATIDSFTGILTGVSGGVATISYTLGCSTTYLVTVNPMPSAISGSVNVCIGGTSALHDAVSGGFWTSSNPFVATVGSSSGIVNGVNLGTATITYVLPGSCYVVKTINVYPLPLVFNVSGGGSYCAGGSGEHVYLSGSTVGVNYLLYRGVTAVGTFAGTGSPLDFGLQTVAGTYTVIGTSTATTCSIAMTGSATIVVMPSVIPSVNIDINPTDTVCAGTSVTFTPVPGNGGVTPTYLWDVNGFPVAFSTTYTFIPANGDIVTVTMTSSANCALPPTATGSVTMNVMPYAAPSVSIAVAPNDTVCKGTVVTLTAVPAYGGIAPLYTWMKNGDVAGGSGTFAWIPYNGDFVYAIMQSNYPCRTANRDTSSQVVITVDTPIAPIVAINAVPGTMVQVGQTVTLTAVVTGGTTNLTYQWLKNGIPIPAATNASYSSSSYNYPKPDSVTCMVTSNGICTVTSYQWTYIQVAALGIKPLSQTGSDIAILPNPNKGEFVVKGSLGTSNDEDVSLEITDMLGQVLYKDKVTAKGGKLNERIQLGNTFANGIYILSVNSISVNRIFHIILEQ